MVFDNPKLGSMRNYLSAAKVMQKQGSGTTRYSETNAWNISRDTMYQYWLATREMHSGCRALHLSIDGVRCGGDETNVFIAYSPALGRGSVPPPEAIWHTDSGGKFAR